MATLQIKARNVFWYAEFKLIVKMQFQRVFKTMMHKEVARCIFSRICREGPRVHDLPPLDFFLWGYVKDLIQPSQRPS
mgnify:CR=1 FL=1